MSTASYDNPILATLDALRQRVTGTGPSRLQETDRIDGDVVVTGANRGLGASLAKALAARGAHTYLAARGDTTEVEQAIRASRGSAERVHVDLADLGSVGRFADRLRGRTIQALLLNAGVVPNRSRATLQGFEIQNGVNYIANVALVDRLVADGTLQEGARVVVVSSESHRSAKRPELDQLGIADRYGMRDVLARYSASKLLLTAWAGRLARELSPRIAVHTICPGPVRTGIANEAPKLGQLALKPIMRLFFAAPEVGAEPVVYLACGRDLEGRTGLYFHRWEEKAPSELAADPEFADELVARTRALIAERTPRD